MSGRQLPSMMIRGALERLTAALTDRDMEHERAIAAHRDALRERDEAVEEGRRLEATIARRRSAPDDGPAAGRRAQLRAEILGEETRRDRAVRERTERAARIDQCTAAITRDERLEPQLAALLATLADCAAVIDERRGEFDAALAADRAAGEEVATELRVCAQEEAGLHTSLHSHNERLTALEVGAQRARDQSDDIRQALDSLALELELRSGPAEEPLDAQARTALTVRLERLERRREQLGPVNPLAAEEYEDAVAHVEELERQRTDLETAMRELEKLIRDTDRQIRETFEETFEAAAANFEELAARLFPVDMDACDSSPSGTDRLRCSAAGPCSPRRSRRRRPTARAQRPRRIRTGRRICSASRSRSPRRANR